MSSRKASRDASDRRDNRRDRRGGGGGGAQSREVQVSKKLSWLLRHGAEKEGLKLGPGGWACLKDVLDSRSLRGMKIGFAEVREVVKDNDKQRYALKYVGEDGNGEEVEEVEDDEDPRHWMIRANQGHSLKVEAGDLLVPVTLEDEGVMETVVHGTTERAWELIRRSGGLKSMGRNHVHFAIGLPKGFVALEEASEDAKREGAEKVAPPVISGMRNSCTVLLFLDVQRSLAAGLPLWRSANDVVLSEGMADSKLVPLELFRRVEIRGGNDRQPSIVLRDGVVLDS